MTKRAIAPTPDRSAVRSRLALAAMVAVLPACGGSPEPSLPAGRVALAELAPPGRAIVETTVIDVGDPAARSHLESGWGPDETGQEGSFAWTGGAAATLRFEVVDRRRTTIGLRGWSFPFTDGDGQRVAVRLNGEALDEFELGVLAKTVRLPVAARRLVAGENRLELRPRRHYEAEGERPWAAAWDVVRVQPGEPSAAPTIGTDGEIVLPARTAFAWTLELPAGAWLAWDGVARERGAWLEVAVRGEAGPERAERFDGAGRHALTADTADLVEVTLRARGAGGAVRLAGARLHQPSPAAATAETRAAAPLLPPRPNLVLYVVDTLRADHLGCYGYALPTSPRLDRFAREAVLWREARAQSSWTKPAMGTLLTGHYPITHGAELRSRRLAPELETLGDRLGRVGYQTAFLTTNPTVAARFGFARGFDVYRFLSRGEGRERRSYRAREVHREVVEWLAQRDATRPFFLVVHTLDPHDPYLPAEPYKQRFAPDVDPQVAGYIRSAELAALPPAAARERARQMRALYDAEIAQNDESFGALVDELARRDLLARTAVVFTSDHGEEFYDHGAWRHAETLYEELLRVPLVVRLPGGALGGTVIEEPADQIDVAPTLLALAGVEIPAALPGGSWLPALAGGAPPDRESLAWLEHPSLSLESAVRGGWKRIRNRGAWRLPLERGPDELFHLARDRGERDDLTRTHVLRRHWLAGRLAAAAAFHGRVAAAPDVAIDPELQRALAALGYL
jgi:arylsulfatase A-like enzyme